MRSLDLRLTRLEACALSEGREGEEQDGMTVERRRGSSCRRDPQIQIHLDDFYKSRRRFYKSSTRVRSVTNAIPIESPRYVTPGPPAWTVPIHTPHRGVALATVHDAR